MYKKLIATFLALAMVFGSCGAAFADTGSSVIEETGGAVPEATQDAVPNLLMVNFMEAMEKAEAAREAAEKAAAEEAARKAAEEAARLAEAEAAADAENAENAENAESAETPVNVETEEERAAREAAELYKEGLAAYMRKINTEMGKKWSLNLAQAFIDIADKYDLDEKVLMALAQRESRFRSKAKSVYGYKGMMQTSDWLAEHYGYDAEDVFDYEVSIDVAARYLSNLKDSFKTYTKALSGYVYGGTRVKNGNYSTKHAKKILETRDTITKFLEKNDYIETEEEIEAREKAEAEAKAAEEAEAAGAIGTLEDAAEADGTAAQ